MARSGRHTQDTVEGCGPDHSAIAPALLDSEAAARYLAITTRHLRRLVTERRIGFVKIGSRVRFRPHDLDVFIEKSRTAARW